MLVLTSKLDFGVFVLVQFFFGSDFVFFQSTSMHMRNSLDGHSLYSATQGMPMFHLQPQQHHHRPPDAPEFASHQLLHRNSEVELSNTKAQETPNMGFLQYPTTLYSQTANSSPSFPSMKKSPLQIPNAFSPTLGLSPAGFLVESLATATPTPQYATFPLQQQQQQETQQHGIHPGNMTVQTPGAYSQTSGGSHATAISEGGEKDPFLTLLEQLAENENSQGGPSELDYFLSGAIEDVSADAEQEAFARLEQEGSSSKDVEADGEAS